MEEERKIHGLTTAASVWVTAAVGMLWPALLTVALTEAVLSVAYRLDRWLDRHDQPAREK